MKIFFYTTEPWTWHPHNIAVINFLEEAGARIYSNLESFPNAFEFSASIDALIVLGGGGGSDIAYVIALTIARNKPILYLHKKATPLPKELEGLAESKDIKKLLHVVSFTQNTLAARAKKFFEQVFGADAYDIKFTLRLNRGLNQYIDTASGKNQITKANFVRGIIEEYRDRELGEKEEGISPQGDKNNEIDEGPGEFSGG